MASDSETSKFFEAQEVTVEGSKMLLVLVLEYKEVFRSSQKSQSTE